VTDWHETFPPRPLVLGHGASHPRCGCERRCRCERADVTPRPVPLPSVLEDARRLRSLVEATQRRAEAAHITGEDGR
jgi:hypothetical protein